MSQKTGTPVAIKNVSGHATWGKSSSKDISYMFFGNRLTLFLLTVSIEIFFNHYKALPQWHAVIPQWHVNAEAWEMTNDVSVELSPEHWLCKELSFPPPSRRCTPTTTAARPARALLSKTPSSK